MLSLPLYLTDAPVVYPAQNDMLPLPLPNQTLHHRPRYSCSLSTQHLLLGVRSDRQEALSPHHANRRPKAQTTCALDRELCACLAIPPPLEQHSPKLYGPYFQALERLASKWSQMSFPAKPSTTTDRLQYKAPDLPAFRCQPQTAAILSMTLIS